ncbi:hypothetical protein ACWGCW_02970 [Streptomyces sp. NPDC054933]
MRRFPAAVALTAAALLTGCVNVSEQPGLPNGANPSPPQRQPALARIEPQPAREELTTTEPYAAASSAPSAAAHPAPGTPSTAPSPSSMAQPTPPAPDFGQHPAPPPPPAPPRPAPRPVPPPSAPRPDPRPAPPPPPPPVHRPDPPAAPPAGQPAGHGDVCGLGETYGRWAPDSPAARICHQTYGR